MVESKFQTSFIPKAPIESGSSSSSRHQSAGLFRMIAFFVLLVALAAWGALFLWQFYINQKIGSATDSLQASQKEFELGTVNTLTRLNDRLTASENILDNHLALSKLFNELSQMTLKNVRFTDFAINYAGADKGLVLTLKGQAVSYGTVAKQSDAFSQNRDFQSPIFSNLDLDSSGRIVFTINTTLDPQHFLYTAGMDGVQSSASTPAPAATGPFNK